LYSRNRYTIEPCIGRHGHGSLEQSVQIGLHPGSFLNKRCRTLRCSTVSNDLDIPNRVSPDSKQLGQFVIGRYLEHASQSGQSSTFRQETGEEWR
jgi:hypothetical protein